MNRREKILIIGVVVVIALFVAAKFLPEDILSSGAFGGGELDQARKSFKDGREWLLKGPDIHRDYAKVDAQFPEREGAQNPESTFSNQMSAMLTEKGWPPTTLSPPKRVAIAGIDDYQYMDIEFKISGEAQRILDLLADLQKLGLLIKEFKVTQPRPDDAFVTLDVTVSRLTKLTEDEKKKFEKSKQRR